MTGDRFARLRIPRNHLMGGGASGEPRSSREGAHHPGENSRGSIYRVLSPPGCPRKAWRHLWLNHEGRGAICDALGYHTKCGVNTQLVVEKLHKDITTSVSTPGTIRLPVFRPVEPQIDRFCLLLPRAARIQNYKQIFILSTTPNDALRCPTTPSPAQRSPVLTLEDFGPRWAEIFYELSKS